MAYEKQNFTDGQVLAAVQLNHIEDGIVALEEKVNRTGSGAPTKSTEGAVGCLYMDTDTGDLYKCTAVVDGVYTWETAGSAPVIEKTSPTSKQGALDDLLVGDRVVGITLLGESHQDDTPKTTNKANITSLANAEIVVNDNITVTISDPLRGIQNENGVWVARDEITAKDGTVKRIQRTGEWVLNGSERGWTQHNLTSAYFFVRTNTDKISGAGIAKNAPMLCDCLTVFAGESWENLGSDEATNIDNSQDNFIIKVPVGILKNGDGSYNINATYAETSGTDALRAWKTWLDTNQPVLVYVLKEAQETDITDTETGAALLDLLTNHDTFSWNGDVPMSVTYRADTAKALAALQEEIEATRIRMDALNIHENVKVITLGDSITAAQGAIGWTTYFLDKINGTMLVNAAVSGAQLADSSNTDNVLSKQVDQIAARAEDAEKPDIIMIAIGTNGGINITEADMVAAYYSGSNLVPLENVDRTTHAGAFRYASEKLRKKYPDAVIFWCSPVHSVRRNAQKAEDTRAWHESLRIATEFTGQRHIDTIHCGINGAHEIANANGECLVDGLHPNEKGAKLIGYYNAGKVNATIF